MNKQAPLRYILPPVVALPAAVLLTEVVGMHWRDALFLKALIVPLFTGAALLAADLLRSVRRLRHAATRTQVAH